MLSFSLASPRTPIIYHQDCIINSTQQECLDGLAIGPNWKSQLLICSIIGVWCAWEPYARGACTRSKRNSLFCCVNKSIMSIFPHVLVHLSMGFSISQLILWLIMAWEWFSKIKFCHKSQLKSIYFGQFLYNLFNMQLFLQGVCWVLICKSLLISPLKALFSKSDYCCTIQAIYSVILTNCIQIAMGLNINYP